MPGLKITEIRIYPFDTSQAGGKTLAMAEITINGALMLKGFRIIQAKGGGLFVGFPSVKGKDGKWRETVATINNEVRTVIRDLIIEKYRNFSA